MYQGVGAEVNRLRWEVSCLLEKASGSVLRLLWLSVPRLVFPPLPILGSRVSF